MKSFPERLTYILGGVLLGCFICPASSPGQAKTSADLPVGASATVTIPGPLPSFLRMAAISQKATPDEILPLLAHNVVVHGFVGKRAPTEYLVLLREYVTQARGLLSLAGQDGVLRVSNCAEAQPLLDVLGYRFSEPCGPNAFVETANAKRAFLTVDSGFPLADLEHALAKGQPFMLSFPSWQVPVLFSPKDWTALGRDSRGDLLDLILHDPASARLYWALSQLDVNTRTVLVRAVGLEKLVPLAPALDFYGRHLHLQSGRLEIPGGSAAKPAWEHLVGADPDSPEKFIPALLAKDKGWLAAYFDALSQAGAAQQAYFTDPRRMSRFYNALRGRNPSPGPAHPSFRPYAEPYLLMTRLQLDPSGQPHIPGGLQVWADIVSRASRSRRLAEWTRRTGRWTSSDQLLESLFGLSREYLPNGPGEIFLKLTEIDRRRSPGERLSPKTVSVLAQNFDRLGDQYLVFSEFSALNNESITKFLSVADAVEQIADVGVRAEALGIFQANLGLWQILARQEQISAADLNASWQRVIEPFADIRTYVQLLDATRTSLRGLWRAATGKTQLTQDEIIALLAGPEQTSTEGRQVRQALADRIRSVLTAQRLISLDDLFALGDGLNRMAQGNASGDSLLPFAAELKEFELPKPLFTPSERIEFIHGRYLTPHVQRELATDLTTVIKSNPNREKLAAARGDLVPFVRDTLVGLNYAYYAPPGSQMILHNPLFVRAHDFLGPRTAEGYQPWRTPIMAGRGSAASGGAHLIGSMADLPYALAMVEQNFIAPENVQSLIWEDLVPSLLVDAVLPRWWRVTRNELHAVALYQRLGEELLTASSKDEKLRQSLMRILSDRLLPQRYDEVEEALSSHRVEAALSQLAPGDVFYLGAEFRRKFPHESHARGPAAQELDELAQRYPKELSWERLSHDFGVPHPALEQTYARELLISKPFPTFMSYSSRLMAESWDSNNLYWARLADESGYPPVMLHLLVPDLTRRMVAKIFATHLEDWPALLRALRETGEEFRQSKTASLSDRAGNAPL